MRKIRWGILGNAQIARVCVAPAIASSRNGVLTAVASRSADRAAELAEPYAARPIVGYDNLLADPEIDAVYIPLPNHLHYGWTLRALEAGKHVLVEKPFAMNAAEAEQMAEAAAASNRLLLEAFMYRFHPRSLRVRRLVQDGELGHVTRIRAAFSFPVTPDGTNDRLFLPEMGGGALWDVGCYGVSVARWLLDDEPLAVTATAITGPTGVDLNFVGILEFSDGALATVECGFTHALQQSFAVYGDRAAVELPHDAFVPWEKDATFLLRPAQSETGSTITIPGADEYQLMVEHFADAVLRVAPLVTTPAESVQQMRVMDALVQSAGSGRRVELSQ